MLRRAPVGVTSLLSLLCTCLGVPRSYTCRSQYPLPSFKLCCRCIFRGNSVDSVHSLLTSCFGRRVVDLLLWCCKIKLVFFFSCSLKVTEMFAFRGVEYCTLLSTSLLWYCETERRGTQLLVLLFFCCCFSY